MKMNGPGANRRVLIVIPTLNEEAHIGGLLEQFTAMAPDLVGAIIVADGGSADATRAIVTEAARADPRITLLENPRRIQSAGINRSVASAPAHLDIVVRVDAHADYPADYVERLVETMAASGAESVVVRLRSEGHGTFQRAVAMASNTRLGSGGSLHRIGGRSQFVNHGHHAAFRRSTFEALGGYDETFEANEDAELDYRLRAAGGRIWFASEIEVGYYPRSTASALWRQYRRYGSGRARNYLKHGEKLHTRQLAPPIILTCLTTSLLLSIWYWQALIVPLSYAVALGINGLLLFVRTRKYAALLTSPAIATMHIAWGVGFLTMIMFRPGLALVSAAGTPAVPTIVPEPARAIAEEA